LAYGFLDANTVLITKSTQLFEVLLRAK